MTAGEPCTCPLCVMSPPAILRYPDEIPPAPSPELARATDLLEAVDAWAQAGIVGCPAELALRHACEALQALAGFEPREALAAAELMAAAVGVTA